MFSTHRLQHDIPQFDGIVLCFAPKYVHAFGEGLGDEIRFLHLHPFDQTATLKPKRKQLQIHLINFYDQFICYCFEKLKFALKTTLWKYINIHENEPFHLNG